MSSTMSPRPRGRRLWRGRPDCARTARVQTCGVEGKRFPWGDELTPDGDHRCNIWQGEFPERNTVEDGFERTAPVDAYEPNGYGLHNVAGNVWEWCADWFSAEYHTTEEYDADNRRDQRTVTSASCGVGHTSVTSRGATAIGSGPDSKTPRRVRRRTSAFAAWWIRERRPAELIQFFVTLGPTGANRCIPYPDSTMLWSPVSRAISHIRVAISTRTSWYSSSCATFCSSWGSLA